MKISSVVRVACVAICLSLALPFAAVASEESHHQAAKDYLQRSHAKRYFMEAGYEKLRVLVDSKKHYAGALPDLKRLYVKYVYNDEFMDVIAEVYADHLTEKELRQLIEFRESEIGRKLTSVESRLNVLAAQVEFEVTSGNANKLRQVLMMHEIKNVKRTTQEIRK